MPALWAKRQLLETETWTTTSEQLIQDSAIQAAVSNFIVTAIYDNVDVEAALAERLPPQLAPLAGPVSGALRNAADDVTLKALEQPKVQQLWVSANAAAQSKLIALLEDKGEFVSTTGGVVTLDLKSLLTSVTAQLGLPGKLVAKLPASASSIEVMKSDELDAAQKGVDLLQTAAYVLTALTLLLYAAAIFLAGDRRRTTLRAVGFSFIVIGAVVLFARSAGGNAVVSSLSGAASSDDAVSVRVRNRHLTAERDRPVDPHLRNRDRARGVARRADRLGDLDPPRDHALPAPAAATRTAASPRSWCCSSGGTRWSPPTASSPPCC